MQLRSVLILAVPLLVTGCGGNSSHSNPSAASISGNWQMALQKTPTTSTNITAISRAANVVSATVSSSAGFPVGSQVNVTGVTDPTYDGLFILSTVDTTTNVLNWAQNGPNSSSSGGSVARQTSVPPRTTSGFLVQNGNTVTGSVMFTDAPCSGVGSVSGTLSGTAISLLVNPTGVNVNLSGNLSSGQNSISGSYTILSMGCNSSGSGSISETGSWTGNLVAPLNGTIQGTFTSKHIGPLAITGQLSQGSNNGSSIAPLTGSLNATNYCFSTANIQGVISGTAVVMNLVNPDGTQIGQVAGTASLDGTLITGTFQIIGLGKGALPNPPCVSGDSGTVTLML
jgi:hypothetical protein